LLIMRFYKLFYLLPVLMLLGLMACQSPPATLDEAETADTAPTDPPIAVTETDSPADTLPAAPVVTVDPVAETSEPELADNIDCGADCQSETAVSHTPTQTPEFAPHGRGMGHGHGPQADMMARHHAPIPQAYAGLTNPLPADDDSLERGANLYLTYCASCHGDGGMGDGPAGTALDPAPAPVARTSQRMGDDYFFWRTSEGGFMDPFNSAMPAWKGALDEQARWDIINYIQALGSDTMPMGRGPAQP